MTSAEIIRILTEDGWEHVGTSGSHWHFKHPAKPGKVTVPHPRRELPIGTLWSVWKQAGLPKRR